ncbi:hypothetical protein QJS04_geneDACA000048 [Acorus gramineus]|uniref:Uncharacterized protein n=1 Tax=Acorus gramineus TaxID=55184 RepID=A0AAV9AU41_ACOGR|nr:hypothetical protein QJS04_geneDACA000048 [Acorus gramineus]
MGWSHPDISLDDLLKLIRGFVDILILACGYQSSGECAVWDAENVKRAVEWGLFFEEVFRRLRDLNMYDESVKELDDALLKLTSNPHFPQGIKHISSSTLTRARSFILEHFIQTLPLNDGHLKAILTTIIEMDIDDLARKEHDVGSYFDKLMVQITSLNLMPSERGLVKGSTSSTWRAGCFSGDQAEPVPCGYPGLRDPHRNSKRDNKEDNGENHSKSIIIELLKRQTGVACISLLGMGLDILSEIATRNNSLGSETLSSEESSSTDIDVM